MYRPLVFCFMWLLPTFLIANDPIGYLEITAKSGDGIYALMRQYQLDDYSCNFKKFYELNRLQTNAPLQQGKKYKLPIYVYSFNGKTIRSSIGLDNWDIAVGIQKYNEQMLGDGLRTRSFKSDRLLWVPFHVFNCANPDLEIDPPQPIDSEQFNKVSNPGYRKFPIFGEQYANTPLLSNKLQGRIFYIVSGHGGVDPGAVGKRGGSNLCEDEYAYDVALRLCRKLIEHGATAYMITRDPDDGIRDERVLKCDEDEVVWGGAPIPPGTKPRLRQRVGIINELYNKNKSLGFSKQQTIVIHVDSRSQRERIDLFFYYQNGRLDSKNLANRLQATMKANYDRHRGKGYYKGNVKTRDLHMLREVEPTSVYIELANIKNTTDQQRIVLQSNREALARWLFQGLSQD